MTATDSMKSYLKNNPRKIGALFTLMVLLMQVQPALGALHTVHGP